MGTTIILWIAALLAFLSPTATDARLQALPGWTETASERDARYQDIAADFYAVVFDPNENPLPGNTREQTLRVLVAIAWHESAFAKDVDVGPCYTGPGHEARCDHGRSVCLMQLHAPGRTTIDGHTRHELQSDRKTCIRAALHVAQQSWAHCKKPGTQLNEYASGYCAQGTANTTMKLATARRLPRLDEREIVAVDPRVR